MPTKAQAKTGIDNAVVDVKSDIDNILPTGVNIKDGSINFNPRVYNFTLDAGNNQAQAISWANTIISNLNTAGRTGIINRQDRRGDDVRNKMILISEAKLQILIVNF